MDNREPTRRKRKPSPPAEPEALRRSRGTAPGIGTPPPTRKRFRIHGPTVFLAGLELWYYVQFYGFSGSFRLQALGVLLLAYWILGALFMTRTRAEEPEK